MKSNKLTMSKSHQRTVSEWVVKISASLSMGYVAFKAMLEFIYACPCSGPWFGRLTTNWAAALIALFLTFFFLIAIALIVIWLPQRVIAFEQKLANQRQHQKKWLWFIGLVTIFLPSTAIYFTDFGSIYSSAPYLRLVFLIVSALVFSVTFTKDKDHLFKIPIFFLGLLLIASLHQTLAYARMISSYPFSLTWSEGNRLYDYSVFFGSDRYLYPEKVTIPYHSPGRHILWGIIYLIPNSPIWLHRLWDALLWVIPSLGLGFILTFKQNFSATLRAIFILWCFLFLAQGPIYAPLLLGGLFVFAFRNPKRVWLTILAVAVATYYVTLSRFTWAAAPAIWAVLIILNRLDLSQLRNKKSLQRIFISMVLFLVIGYLIAITAIPGLLNPVQLTKAATFEQPLLWSRLLPNATLQEGILLGLLIAAGPVLILLGVLAVRRVWAKSWIQRIIYLASLLFFLAIGLVASVKIGGGSNLHNLDMFLVTLVLLAALSLQSYKQSEQNSLPAWLGAVVFLTILIPSWNSLKSGSPQILPDKTTIEQTLIYLNQKIPKRLEEGEVLFIDQRQLLTFGYVKNVPLVPEYEKKYLMDKAMSGDEVYFKAFYEDLSNQRFSLIITNPIFDNIQDAEYRFEEENNAWVKWVAKPLFCYYAPVETNTSIGIQFLVPRLNQPDCSN
jgi:hypothetical protein